jgi:hypothetical protein
MPDEPEGELIMSEDTSAKMNGPTPPAATTDNPFADLARLRISQNYADAIGVTKMLLTVPVKKPERQWFVRVHPSPEYRLTVALLELRDERVTYVVDPDLAAALPGDVKVTTLFTAINRQGTVFLWPGKLPGDGRQDEWSRTALEAANLAQTKWVKVVANLGLGAYEVSVATATLPEPGWPELTFNAILEIAFKDRFIRTTDHPVLRRLRGEI